MRMFSTFAATCLALAMCTASFAQDVPDINKKQMRRDEKAQVKEAKRMQKQAQKEEGQGLKEAKKQQKEARKQIARDKTQEQKMAEKQAAYEKKQEKKAMKEAQKQNTAIKKGNTGI